jgi:hypothetical protein
MAAPTVVRLVDAGKLTAHELNPTSSLLTSWPIGAPPRRNAESPNSDRQDDPER